MQPLKVRCVAFNPNIFRLMWMGGCDTCKGEGEQIVEMQFLADVHLNASLAMESDLKMRCWK